MTPNIKWFLNYSVDARGTIQLANGHECIIAGIGEIPIRLPNDNMITLHQVRHVPDRKRSLVSIDMLVKDGYRTTLNESAWMINRGNLRIGSGHKYNNLYPMIVINLEGDVNVIEKTNSNLWHNRLGHISQAKLERLITIHYIPKT